MTHAPNNLEDLRLLREARLPSGFEERLRERLVAAASEKKVLRFGPRRRHHGLLLLAAIALPVAAFAAGGVLIAQRFADPVKPPASSVGVTQPTAVKQRAVGLPVGRSARVSSETKTEERVGQEPQRDENARGSTVKIVAPSRVDVAPAKVESPRAQPLKVERVKAEPERTETVPATVESEPAQIESLELSLPTQRDATSRAAATSGSTKDSALRGAAEKGQANRVGADSDGSTQSRSRAGERQGSDAASQAKERVQARERKGQ
jgi:hypothetical protein